MSDFILSRFDELYVVSDIHMGGPPGFQILNQGPRLGALARQRRPLGLCLTTTGGGNSLACSSRTWVTRWLCASRKAAAITLASLLLTALDEGLKQRGDAPVTDCVVALAEQAWDRLRGSGTAVAVVWQARA